MGLKKRCKTRISPDSRNAVKEKIRILNNNVKLCREYKQETIRHVRKLEGQYKKRIFNYAEYEYSLNKYLKGLPLEYWTQHYKLQEKKLREKIKGLSLQKRELPRERFTAEEKIKNNFLIYTLALFLLLGIMFVFYQTPLLGNLITGLTVGDDPFIQTYTPENDPEIIAGSSQTFTITTFAQENNTLSIQWYVNNLPVISQDLETFSYVRPASGA